MNQMNLGICYLQGLLVHTYFNKIVVDTSSLEGQEFTVHIFVFDFVTAYLSAI